MCIVYPFVKVNVFISSVEWLEPNSISTCFIDGNLMIKTSWIRHPQFNSQIMESLGIKASF
jgi:hypothetical protein